MSGVNGYGRTRSVRSNVRSVKAPRETLITKAWCDQCRRMHEPEAHVCRHDFRDGDTCSKCEQLKGTG